MLCHIVQTNPCAKVKTWAIVWPSISGWVTCTHAPKILCIWRIRHIIKLSAPFGSPGNAPVFIGHIAWLCEQHWYLCYTRQINYILLRLDVIGQMLSVGFVSILVGWIPISAWFTSRLLVHLRFLYMSVGQPQISPMCVAACRLFVTVCLELGCKIPGFMISVPTQIPINQGSIRHVQFRHVQFRRSRIC